MQTAELKNLLDALRQLLREYEGLDSILDSANMQYYSSSSEEVAWDLAFRDYIRAADILTKQVHAVLEVAGRLEEVQCWDSTVKPMAQLTPGTVEMYVRGLRLTLQGIRAKIESEYGYAPDLAQVSNTPFLSGTDISDAYKMSELYTILHCYENSARVLIQTVLSKKLGDNWWDQASNKEMVCRFNDRMQTEQKNRWLAPRGGSPLHYLDWGDLVKLIRKNEESFKPYIGSLRFIENRFEELELLRNIIAHNGVVQSDDDYDRVIISFRDWCGQVGGDASAKRETV